MPTTSPNLGLTLPTPNVDTGWGSTLNTDFTIIDNLFAAGGGGPSVGLNVGAGKTLNVGGTLVGAGTIILGSGDGTNSAAAATIRGAAKTGTNVLGPYLVIDACNGTGNQGSGDIVFRTSPAGAPSGSTPGVLANKFTVGRDYVYAFDATAPAYDNTTKLATTSHVRNTVSTVPPVQLAADYTVTINDFGYLFWSNSASAIRIIVPSAASVPFPNGTRIDLLRWGTGAFSVFANPGVYIQSVGSKYNLASQGSAASLYKILGDSWALIGDLA